MVSITEAEALEIQPVIARQCEIVAARYDGVEAEDLAQEVWVLILGGELPLAYDYIQRGEIGRLTKAVYNIAVTWCEKDRRAKMREAGVNWRDEYNYSRPEVARLLPAALDPQSVPGLSGGPLHDAPSGKGDPAVGGNMLASLVDVRTAYSKLSGPDQQFVLSVIGLDTNWEHVANTTGLKAASAYAKYMRILDRMVTRHLGRKTDDAEDSD